MKTFKQTYRGLLTATILALPFVLAGASRSFADDWGGHYRYYDRDGYRDGDRHYHHFDYYHHHRGYWDERSEVRIWINV